MSNTYAPIRLWNRLQLATCWVALGSASAFTAGIGAAALVVGCGEESPEITCTDPTKCGPVSHSPLRLEAHTLLTDIAAGQPIEIGCRLHFTDATSEELAPEAYSLEVEPIAGFRQDGATLTFVTGGIYQVSCKTESQMSQAISIGVGPGPAAFAFAVLDQSRVSAGAVVNATCRIEDALGNEVAGEIYEIETSPRGGITVMDRALHTRAAAEYQVGCDTARSGIESVPATLTVDPGAAVSVLVTLDRYSVEAGTRVEVSCNAVDAFQNAILEPFVFTAAPEPTDRDPTSLTPTVAGDYQVSCSLVSSPFSSDPVLLSVGAAKPASLQILALLPAKPVYARLESVELLVDILDRFGNDARLVGFTVEGLPAGSIVDSGTGMVTLLGNGNVEIVATARGPTDSGSPVLDSVLLVVDAAPPEITFTFPERGAIVQGWPGQSVTIAGQVSDLLSPVTDLFINGDPVVLGASGQFQHALVPEWGINTVVGLVTDAAGNSRTFVRAFEYGSEYRRAGTNRTVSGRIADGLVAHLGQAALDDNNSDVDDLATIARLAIENADLNALIPDPVTNYHSDCSVLFVTIVGDLRLWVDDVRFSRPIIDITAINGGLRLRAEIPNVAVDMHTTGDVCDIGIGVSGTASATRVIVTGDLLVRRLNGQVDVSMPAASVQISGLNVDLDLPGIIDWAVDGIISLFAGVIADRLEDAFRGVIRGEIPPVVRGFLESISLGTGFDLPAPISLRLNLGAGLGLLDFDTAGGNVGLDSTVYASAAITPEPLGGILQEVFILPTFRADRALGVGLSYDLINQALYSLWYGGGLDIDLTNTFLPGQLNNGGQMTNVSATVRALLPPVLSSNQDPMHPVMLNAADVELAIDLSGIPNLPPIQLTAYASVEVAASARINAAGELELMAGPNPVIELELDLGPDLAALIDIAELSMQLEIALADLIPLVFTEVIKGIPLPTFDLSTMAGGFLPPGIELGLGNGGARFLPSFIVLEGDLVPVP